MVFLVVLSLTGLAAVTVTAQAIRVNVMPDGIHNPIAQVFDAYTWPGMNLEIWGNVVGGTPPYTYVWNFGDGSPVAGGAVSDPRNIAEVHQYTTTGPKYATLIVTDDAGVADTDVVRIDVVPEEFQYQSVNLAIQKGLKWVYLNDYDSISWEGWTAEGQYRAGAFGLELLAFQNKRHFSTNPPDDDIYAEHVQKGLDIFFSRMFTEPGGHGRYFNDASGFVRPLYETGIALMAIVATGTPGRPYIDGVDTASYFQIAQDLVEYLVWAQNDVGSPRGGWRYQPNYPSSDNSVTQWPAIGMEAAESEWGVVIPDSVKTKLLQWTTYSQNGSNGGFGYSSASGTNVGLTAAGLCELAFCDVPYTDTRIQNALNYISNNWNQGLSTTSGNRGNYYAMYGVAKGCRIAVDEFGVSSEIEFIGTHDWQVEYNQYLIDNQNAAGWWNGSNYGSTVLDTDFGVLILIEALVCNPYAVIDAPDTYPAGKPFIVDGSGSHHQGACTTGIQIVEWLWDYDNSDGVDWMNADAAGQTVVHPGYVLPAPTLVDTFTITLRVGDNQAPPRYDVTAHTIIIDTTNTFPVADCGGPYAGRIAEEICFNGTGSFDPDSGDYIASYSWDLNGDGVFGDCTDSICCTTFTEIGSWYIGLVVTDSYGAGSVADTCFTTIWTSQIDLAVDSSDISFSPSSPQVGQSITISAAVHCQALIDTTVSNVRVRFYDGDPSLSINQIGADQILPDMDSGDVEIAQVNWVVPDSLEHLIYVKVDPDGELEEYDETNNTAFKAIKTSGLTPTNEWINVFCAVPMLNGVALEPGDIIRAYDPDGVLCGIDSVRADGSYGFMPIYAEEPFNPGDQGAEPGDTISFTINGEEVFTNPVVIWTTNGDGFELCDFFTCQLCSLPAGWNLVSWNRAYNATIQEFMALLIEHPDCVEVMLGFDQGALTYDPDLTEYSTLDYVDYHFGYWLLLSCPVELEICAGKIPVDEYIHIYSDWNLIGYWPDEILPTETALASILDYVRVALGYDGSGLTYIPGEEPFNTLTELEPCYGYWIKSTDETHLSYPGWDRALAAARANPLTDDKTVDVVASPKWVSLYGSDITLDGAPLVDNSLLEAFTSEGVLCGRGRYVDRMLKFMPVYGYESSGQVTSTYPKAGETVTIHVNGEVTMSTLSWSENGDRIRVRHLQTGADVNQLPTDYFLYQNHPNPFNPATEIGFALPQFSHVILKVYNIEGREVLTLLNEPLEAGEHRVTFDGCNSEGRPVASGVYFYRLEAGDFVETKKMLLLK